MCGLFGALHCGSTESLPAVATTVLALGMLSEERGKDASGVAIVTPGSKNTDPATRKSVSADVFEDDGITVVKAPQRFTELAPLVKEHLDAPHAVFIGHTRWATQGDVDSLANTSPLLAGHLVGTHNGDVEVTSVPDGRAHAANAFGGTDTEVLYRALDKARGDRRKMTKVLRAARGRIALAYMNRQDTSRLYLARGALSPLSFAFDTEGNFYWASNPNWFRAVSQATGVTFASITLVPEGHLLTVNTTTGEVEDARRFTPTCRESDLRLVDTAVYRNFDADDKAADKALQRHIVATRLPEWKSLTAIPVRREPAAQKTQQKASRGRVSVPEFPGVSYPSETLIDDPWARYDDLPTEYQDDLEASEPVDIDEVEELCWNGNEFDLVTYQAVLEADDETAHDMVAELRAARQGGRSARLRAV